MVQEMQEWKRGFSLSKVLPESLSKSIPIGDVVKGIVDQLKRDADVLSEAEEGGLPVGGGVRDDGADSTGGGDQSRRLVFDDAKVFGLRDRRITVVVELENLTFGHLSTSFRQDFIGALAPKPDDLA